jgi:hypothetical protein
MPSSGERQRPHHGEPVAVPRGRGGVSGQGAVGAVIVQEVFEVGEEVHASVTKEALKGENAGGLDYTEGLLRPHGEFDVFVAIGHTNPKIDRSRLIGRHRCPIGSALG